MNTIDITAADIKVGQEITLWYGFRGQGGTVTKIFDDGVALACGTAGVVQIILFDKDITRITAEVPFDADECLNYSPECRGPVEYWHPGGMSAKAWPRCTFHGEKRLQDYEDSMERYADSDCVPAWFDPADAGERWEED